MEETSENQPMKKHISIGLLAHVDAGKTTLSESILYHTGKIRKMGRVDHGDAFFDTYGLERSRGITIFSKQAVIGLGEKEVTLLDTPGHVDFSAETERTLQILDYAVLVISGADGVQGHTRTLWDLLKRYRVPVFLFINKMDQEGADKGKLLADLKENLDENCMEFTNDLARAEEAFLENLAVCDERAMEEYLRTGSLSKEAVVDLVWKRKVFPCYFGSALKMQGVRTFLEGLDRYTWCPWARKASGAFGAQVYKITRDSKGNRLTHLKIVSGSLKVKDSLAGKGADGPWEEKINQIRIYSGERFEAVPEAYAGMVCAVAGLSATYAGEGLGVSGDLRKPALEPVLNYQIELPPGSDVHSMLRNLRQLEEEDPMLQIAWNGELSEIHAHLMGEVQIEVLESVIKERFGETVSFGAGSIIYKETIRNTVEGVGHYEPLRHYAEVHLILQPGERGSGLVFDTACPEDELDLHWQRLILTHLKERTHRGVLTGAAVTDMKITLAAGRAHLKHTEGGDFRQAAYRALRQGLMQAESVLLEPYYQFRLEVPAEDTGRAMTDIQRMSGETAPPQTQGGFSVLEGKAPAATMKGYKQELMAYSKGQGRLSCVFAGFFPCHNAEAVIQECGYDAPGDREDPAGSVFCSHGAGVYVPWDEVFSHMHIESRLQEYLQGEGKDTADQGKAAPRNAAFGKAAPQAPSQEKEEKELEEIFIRTYGKYGRRIPEAGMAAVDAGKTPAENQGSMEEYLLVDGYNVIFAWEDLKELAKENIEAARGKLMDILSNYQGFRKCVVIAVFDAYRVEGEQMEVQKYHNIHVVYTKEAETADQYIEKVVHQIGRKYHVTVVTSDGVEQVVTLGQGGALISAREFKEEVEAVKRQIAEEGRRHGGSRKNYLFDHMDPKLRREMEQVRLGKNRDNPG